MTVNPGERAQAEGLSYRSLVRDGTLRVRGRIEARGGVWHIQWCDCLFLLSVWDLYWQLPECLHFAHSGGDFHCRAGFALPAVPEADQAVRQCSGSWLAVAAGEMPELPATHFADVPDYRVSDRRVLRADVLHVWIDAAHFQVFDLWVPADRADCYRPAGAHFAGCD